MVAMSGFAWMLWAIVVFTILLSLAFWPARVAARKGHSWILFFVFSLFLFPLALITAYVVPDRRVYSPPYA
jgi:hypothetical protein